MQNESINKIGKLIAGKPNEVVAAIKDAGIYLPTPIKTIDVSRAIIQNVGTNPRLIENLNSIAPHYSNLIPSISLGTDSLGLGSLATGISCITDPKHCEDAASSAADVAKANAQAAQALADSQTKQAELKASNSIKWTPTVIAIAAVVIVIVGVAIAKSLGKPKTVIEEIGTPPETAPTTTVTPKAA